MTLLTISAQLSPVLSSYKFAWPVVDLGKGITDGHGVVKGIQVPGIWQPVVLGDDVRCVH